MDQFRPQLTTRLRSLQQDSDDRPYTRSSSTDQRSRQEDNNVYDSFDDRRRSFDDPFHRTRGKLFSWSLLMDGSPICIFFTLYDFLL